MVPRILWGALLSATVIFLGVLFWQRRAGVLPAAPEDPMFLLTFAVAALSASSMSVVMPLMFRRKALLAANLAVEEIDDTGAIGMFRQSAPKVRVFSDAQKARAIALATYQTSLILGMAMAESVALFGFVLGFLGFAPLQVLPFWIVAWLLMLSRFPNDKAIDEPLEKVYDARLR